jgi:hypothetical protein
VTHAALAGIAAFALAYLLAGPLELPILVYDPAAKLLSVSRTVTGTSMRYFGDLLLASAAGLAAAAAAYRVRPRVPVAVAAAAALSVVAVDVLFYFSRLLEVR